MASHQCPASGGATGPAQAPTNPPLPSSTPAVPQRSVDKVFFIRAGAYVIDYVAILVVTVAVGFVIGIFLGLLGPILGFDVARAKNDVIADLTIGNMMAIGYFVIFEWLCGATPGKLLLGQRVVQQDGRPCTLSAALVRGVLRLVDGLVFGYPAYLSMKRTPLQQRLGDRAAKTVVLSARDPRIQRRRPLWGWAAATALALLLVGVLPHIAASAQPPAADLNLQRAEVIGYSLKQDERMDASKDMWDSNIRLFVKAGTVVESRVLVWKSSVTDETSAMIKAMEDSLRGNFSEPLVFEPSSDTRCAERGAMRTFGNQAGDRKGYVLFLMKRNVVATLVVYGTPGNVNADDVQDWACKIEARIQ